VLNEEIHQDTSNRLGGFGQIRFNEER
jgi:hypothetical protein